MPKVKVNRYYRVIWEQDFPWCRQAPDESGRAYCVYCRVTIQPKKASLREHEKVVRHRVRAPKGDLSHLGSAKIITMEETELRLAAYMVCHNSFSGVDHLSKTICKLSCGKSDLTKSELDSNKASTIIPNVLSASSMEDLKNELHDQEYSLFADVLATDFGQKKLLAIIIRHLGGKPKTMIDDLLGFVEFVELSGEELFQGVIGVLSLYNLDITNCISFACDGASVVSGFEVNFWEHFRMAHPKCIQIKCISNSLALLVENTFRATMPQPLFWLIRQIRLYFKKDVVKKADLVGRAPVLDAWEECLDNSYKNYKESRWLVKHSVLSSISENWAELDTYFSLMDRNLFPAEHRHTLDVISEILKDESYHIHLIFLCPLVKEFERLNLLFQGKGISGAEKAYKALAANLHSLKKRAKKMDSGFEINLPLSDVDFGVNFNNSVIKYVQKGGDVNKANEVRDRCWAFLLQVIEETEKRLPEHKDLFKMVNMYSSEAVLNENKPMLSRMPFIDCIKEVDMDEIDQQWRLIGLENWSEKEPFKSKEKMPKDLLKFWLGIRNYTRLEEDDTSMMEEEDNPELEYPFAKLANFVLGKLTMAHSTASVETLFSVMDCMKRRFKDDLNVCALESVLRIRSFLQNRRKCCIDLDVTEKMLELYKNTMSSDDGENEEVMIKEETDQEASEEKSSKAQSFEDVLAFLPDRLR